MDTTTVSRRRQDGTCPFCKREMPLTFHHLIPKKMHRRKRFRKLYTRQELARGIYVCRDCHDGIHCAYGELELAQRFATPEALAADPALDRHFHWLSKRRRRAPQ